MTRTQAEASPTQGRRILREVDLPLARLLGGILAATWLTIAAPLQAAEARPDADVPVDYRALMRSTVDALIASQTQSGLFPYGFDFLADQPLEPGRVSPENLIRQAGTASALAAYYQRTHDPRLRETLQRILAAFDRHSLPIGKSRLQRWIERAHLLSIPFARWRLQTALLRHGLLYEPEGEGKVISSNGKYDIAAAGTVALALLAELRYADASGDDHYAALRASWLRGLLDLRIPGGGFRWLPTSIDDTPYYNGEGWLALAVYRDLHPEDTTVAAELDDLDRAMIERYTQQPDPDFYSWGAMAAAQRYRTTRDGRFLAFLRGQAKLFLARFRGRLEADANNCDAMEGAAATLGILETEGGADGELAQRLQTWVTAEAAKLPRMQLRSGQGALVLGGDAKLSAPRMAGFGGAFLMGLYDPSTRVDLMQHCLSAMVMLDRAGRPSSPR